MVSTVYNYPNNQKFQIQYAPAMQQVQFIPNPIVQLPFSQVVYPTLPQSLPQILGQIIPSNIAPMFWDVNTNSVIPSVPHNLVQVDANGNQVAPTGYSFVLMNVVQPSESVSSESVESSHSNGLSTASVSKSRSASIASRHSTTSTEEPKKRKFRHRSKQERILEIHAVLKEMYTLKGLYAEDEVLRGFDTVRVHVKTYRGLNKIHCPLEDVENHPDVKILKITTPFSMKNKFQKKGFIVYLKLQSADQVPIVQEIFSNYQDYFNKCDVALKREDKIALDLQRSLDAEVEAEDHLQPLLSVIHAKKYGQVFDNWDDSWIQSPELVIRDMVKHNSGCIAA